MNKRNAITVTIISGLTAAFLASCETTPRGYGQDVEAAETLAPKMAQLDKDSGASIAQISTTDGSMVTTQISTPKEEKPLTVAQLRAYADRCQPDSVLSPPPDLDCSELKLRIERRYNNEDEVRDALITLDRLGRTDSKRVADDLNRGETRFSLESQAVAGGFFDTAPPPPPPEETDAVQDLLDSIGQGIDPGTIIAQQ